MRNAAQPALLHELPGPVAAHAVGVAHLGDHVLRARERRLGSLLRDRARAGHLRLLQLAQDVRQLGRGDGVAEPPTGHRVDLREAVDGDDAAGLVEAGGGDVLAILVEHHLVVDVVRDQVDVVLVGETDERLDELTGEDGAGRVPRRVREDRLRPRRDERAKLVEVGQEAVFPAQLVEDRNAAEESDHLVHVREPRRRQENLVARARAAPGRSEKSAFMPPGVTTI